MVGYVLWAVLFSGLLVLEGLALTERGHEWPSISDLLRAVTRPTAGRWVLFALWLWAGWHLFIRGWQFFLRGHGAGTPHSSRGQLGFTATLVQVVLPLVAMYALLMSSVFLGRRAARDAPRADELEGPRSRRAFARYVVVTTFAGYAIFVAVIGAYELAAGHAGSGLFWSAVVWGAFLAFAVAMPVFFVLTVADARLFSRATLPARARRDDARTDAGAGTSSHGRPPTRGPDSRG